MKLTSMTCLVVVQLLCLSPAFAAKKKHPPATPAAKEAAAEAPKEESPPAEAKPETKTEAKSESTAVAAAESKEIKAAPAESKASGGKKAEPAAKTTEQAAAADPAAKPNKIGIGANVKVGLLVPTNRLGPHVLVGLEVRERFPFLKRILGVSLGLDFFTPSYRSSGTSTALSGEAYNFSTNSRAFQLAIDALAFLPLSLPVDIYGGIGYSIFFYTTTQTAFNVAQQESLAHHGFRARAGVLWPFWGPLYASFELSYQYTGFQFQITGPVNGGVFVTNLNFGFEL